MDLGGLQVRAITSFRHVWTADGANNTGATFYEPSQVPIGFSMLASYAQPNNRPLFGSILVARAAAGNSTALKPPVDYNLVWTSQHSNITTHAHGFFWEPICDAGYNAVGHLVMASPAKPPLSKVQCVSSNFTDRAEMHDFVWSTGRSTGFHVFTLWPSAPSTSSPGVPVGAFWGTTGSSEATPTTLVCLKNTNINSSMPSLAQIEELVKVYSPQILLHPSERYLPCSVDWFFDSALLFRRGLVQPDSVPIEPNGTNLPSGSGGADDGAYWLDTPAADRGSVKRGNLSSARVYVQAKPMFGGATTYLTFWVFFAFKGPARLKVGNVAHLQNISLGLAGEHLGDWKHLTLAVRNLDSALTGAFYGANGGGQWVLPSGMEFWKGTNKPVAYAAEDGHGFYPAAGVYVKGVKGVGIRSDTAKGGPELDAGASYKVIAADYLGLASPPWVQYLRRWGPTNSYTIAGVLEKLEFLVPGEFIVAYDAAVLVLKLLPPEVLGVGVLALGRRRAGTETNMRRQMNMRPTGDKE